MDARATGTGSARPWDPETDVVGFPPLSTRARKREERRDRVYAAAIALFVEQGFEATSMEDIAARSGLARATVFNHFARKALFLEEWALRRRQRAAAATGRFDPSALPLREVLARYFTTLAEVNLETRTETKAMMAPSLKSNDVFRDHVLAKDLAALVAASGARLRPPSDPARVGRLLALGYYAAVVRWIDAEPAPFRLDEELSSVLEIVLGGALA